MDTLDREISSVLSRETFQNATIGIRICDAVSSRALYSYNSHLSITPASNQKLVTAAVALKNLDPGFTYQTVVQAVSGPDSEGIIHGDVWLKGSGDPSLTSDRLDELAQDLVECGIKMITGTIVGDGTIFDDQLLGMGWCWDDEPHYYSAQVAGLNCNGNVVTLSVSPGTAEGQVPKILINGLESHEESYVSVACTAKTVAEKQGHTLAFHRRRGHNSITVEGTVALGHEPVLEKITVEEPASFAASRFALSLKKVGIQCAGGFRKATKPPSRVIDLAVSTSHSLPCILKTFMKQSNNLYGEAILKTCGHHASVQSPGSATSGVAAIKEFLTCSDISTSGIVMVDGSGLSQSNSLTAGFVCDLLTHIFHKFPRDMWELFLQALPVGGVDGTLANRFTHLPLKGRVNAKTGSLDRVSSLSGFIADDTGRTKYIFSILMSGVANAGDARQGQDDILRAIMKCS